MRSKPPIKKPKYNKQSFIDACRVVHGNSYDYSDVPEVVILREAVAIFCPIHGKFLQRAQHHLSGSICKSCSMDQRINTHATRARKLSNWNSSEAELLTYGKVKVKCPIHGPYVTSEYTFKRKTNYCSKCRNDAKGEWNSYRDEVRRLTKLQWSHNSKFIRTFSEQTNGKHTYHIDHILSVRDGFEYKLEPWLVAHWCNLAMIPAEENWRKGRRSLRTPETLKWVYKTLCEGLYNDVKIK